MYLGTAEVRCKPYVQSDANYFYYVTGLCQY